MEGPETGHGLEAGATVDPRNRLAAGLFLAVWAVAGWWSLLTNPQIVGVDFGQDPGPGLLPAIVLAIVSAGAIALVAAGAFGLAGTRLAPIAWRPMLRQAVMPGLIVLSLAGYVPLVRWIGFLPANALFACAWMMLLARSALRRNPVAALLPILLGTAVGVGLVYLVFIYWIGVPLR